MNKTIPQTQPWTEPFWNAAREGRLLIQRCQDCRQHIFYPRLRCPFCLSERIDWVESSGRGAVYTFSVVQNNPPSAFAEDVPFVIAIVRLEEGVQMMTNIVGCDPADVCCEMPVQVTFEQVSDELTLPKFRPIG
ncbi:MAG: Zn-ribbon domain-containing OB-fold protein [Anaerolineae bacterium]